MTKHSITDKKAELLSRLTTSDLIATARNIADKPALSDDERLMFAWMMGEVVRRAEEPFDQQKYRNDVPRRGPVDAALDQLTI